MLSSFFRKSKLANQECRKCWKCRNANHISDERWINPETEDLEIYLAAYSGCADRVFYAISYLIDEGSFSFTDIMKLLTYRFNKHDVRLPKLRFSNTVKCLDELIKVEMKHLGPDFLKGCILYGIAIEKPEKINLIRRLLNIDCNINITDPLERNILHRLALKDFSSRPYLQVAELLIKRGIDKDAMDCVRRTPLEYAVRYEKLEMLRLLLRSGATKVSDDYQNIAHCALRRRSTSCLHAIINFYLVRKFQGKIVDDNIMNFITAEQISEHYNLCLKDLESLKNNIIINTNVSLYDILFKPKQYVVKYLRNKDVLSAISRIIMEKSEFSYDLEEIQDTVLIRRDLEDSSLIMLKKHLKLPELCLEKIISHLDNDSLRNVTALETSSKPRRYYRDLH